MGLVYWRPYVRNPDAISVITNAEAASIMWILFAQQINLDSILKLSSIRGWSAATTWDVFVESLASSIEAIGKQIFSQNALRIRKQLRSS